MKETETSESIHASSGTTVTAKPQKPLFKRWWFWTIIVVIAISIIGGRGSGSTSTAPATDTSSKVSTASNDNASANSVPTKEVPSIPTEYLNALAQAETYSSQMHMSKKGLYAQLTSEYGGQFPADAAQYAVDNVNADWNANALAQAKDYQATMNMSKNAVYDQLISEYGGQFTADEAQYAVDHLDD